MDIETRLKEYEQVPGYLCPAEFWPALGYEGEARFVAIWWEMAGDEASWADGRDLMVGAEWPAYLELMEANEMDPIVLGSSETPASHWLVVDRETERAWLVPAEEAAEVLRLQWSVVEIAPLPSDSMAEWLAMLQRHEAQARPISMADVERRMVESRRRFEALEAALAARQPR